MSKTVLVTGGAGYIGSHMVVELQQTGYNVVVLDNLSNSSQQVFECIKAITGQEVEFIHGDISDATVLEALFSRHKIDVVIHFAGLKSVGESVQQPLRYYQNNVASSLVLFDVMAKKGCKRLVFSSSATVYGDPLSVPIGEDFPLSATNPYGESKLMIENILRHLSVSDNAWQISLLRYFNPVGAHHSGLIGEHPSGIPNNLVPYVAQVALGKLSRLKIFGGDYNTPDGTGVRDYIHVCDLVRGHLAAMKALATGYGCVACNLGTGRGYSVLEIVAAFTAVSGRKIPYDIVERRAGDIAECYADTTFSKEALNWVAKQNIEDMIEDHWRWQQKNPSGYGRHE